jgi:predicted MarR family transcription regulator
MFAIREEANKRTRISTAPGKMVHNVLFKFKNILRRVDFQLIGSYKAFTWRIDCPASSIVDPVQG